MGRRGRRWEEGWIPPVRALATKGGDIYAGGDFTAAGGVGANHIALWNGSTWSALGSGTDNVVNALAADGNVLFVGGEFTRAGEKASSRFAEWTMGASFGSLQVTIEPPEAVTSGAQWRRTGTATWLNSGQTEISVPVGQRTVEFRDVAGWTTPADQPVTIISDQTTTATGIYVKQLGSLQVTIEPPEAATLGAQWRRVGTAMWQGSGDVETSIPVGPQTVEFKDVAGWTKPADQMVTILLDETTTATGIYVQRLGSLQVTVEPPEAVTLGAKWRRAGTAAWQECGETETSVPVGAQTVEFKEVAGWTKPVDQPVTIVQDETTTATGTYVEQTGSLQVTLQPPGAVTGGAKWRRTGTAAWLDSGTTETGIPVGDQTVEFKDVPDWSTPPNQPVTIHMDETATATGTYVAQVGSLQVTLHPPAAVTAGAKWRRTGTATWLDSGTPETGIPVGDQTVEFNDISGWNTPPDQPVAIHGDETTTASATYDQQVGSLQVTLNPSAAVTAGAKWRRSGTATWLDSGVDRNRGPGRPANCRVQGDAGLDPAAGPIGEGQRG